MHRKISASRATTYSIIGALAASLTTILLACGTPEDSPVPPSDDAQHAQMASSVSSTTAELLDVVRATETTPPAETTGTLRLWLTDRPRHEIDALYVTISRLDVVYTADGSDTREWTRVVDEPLTYDLMELKNGVRAEMGLAILPPGVVHKFWLTVESAEVVVDGKSYPVFIPFRRHKRIKLVHEVMVFPGANTDVIFDFDAYKSLVRKGHCRHPSHGRNSRHHGSHFWPWGRKCYMLRPVIDVDVIPDTEPPVIRVDEPELGRHPLIPETGFVQRDVSQGSALDIRGRVEDASGVAALAINVNGTSIAVERAAGGQFSATGALVTSGSGTFVDNIVDILAQDHLGQLATRRFVVRVKLTNDVPGRLLVRFNSQATQLDIDQVLTQIGATVLYRYAPSLQYHVAVDPTVDEQQLARQLSTQAAVAYAMPDSLIGLHDVCGAGSNDDPYLNTPGQYYLGKSSGSLEEFIALDPGMRYCVPGVPDDCATEQDQCYLGYCVIGTSDPETYNADITIPCSNDSLCQTLIGSESWCSRKRFCRDPSGAMTTQPCSSNVDCADTCETVGLCGRQGVADADIGWLAASAEVCSVDQSGPDVIVAIAEPGIANMLHRDLQPRVWTNLVECGGVECTSDTECQALGGSRCVFSPGYSTGRCDGPDSDVLADCVQGQASPGDGCPGLCGDDDGDGRADFLDPEVQDLVWRLLNNGLDDDEDGTSDEPDEAVLAEEDDDESGYIDDIHGFNFDLAATVGERAGSTHPAAAIGFSEHALRSAGAVAAELDNGYDLAGVNPRGLVMLLGIGNLTSPDSASTVRDFVPAMHYATSHGARVVNLSWDIACTCTSPCTGTALADYQSCVVTRSQLFADGLDTSMLYTVSAGNSRDDLTTAPVPASDGTCAAGECRWHFPQNVGTYLNMAGNPIPEGTGSPYSLVIAASNIRGELADFYIGSDTSGSNVGSINANGGSAVDFAAPADSVDELSGTDVVVRVTGQTSFAAPVVAGAASVLMSRFPTSFDRRPLEVVDHLIATLAPCTTPTGPTLRTCTNNMLHEGRLDLAAALTAPEPVLKPYQAETWRLHDPDLRNTTDVDFIDGDGDGDIDYLLEVFGGPFPDQDQPRLFVYNPGAREFHDRTYGDDGAVGGSGGDADRLPDLQGNYNKTTAADFDGDGCTDFVLPGFLRQDPDANAQPGDLAGTPNRLVFQVRDSSACTGRFTEVGNDPVGDGGAARLPSRDDITRDVDAFDFDGDGDIDIFFTNAVLPFPGGQYSDQLFANRLVESGTAYFVDESWRLPADNPVDTHRSRIAPCDVDNDGDDDIIQASITGAATTNRLLISQVNGAGERVFVDEAADRGFPTGTGFSHDVECHDFTGDGFPEVLIGRRNNLQTLYLVNDGDGTFTLRSDLLPPQLDTTQEIELCDLDANGVPELLIGNGDVLQWYAEANRLLEYDPASGTFADNAEGWGFKFAGTDDLTEDIECADLDGNGSIDAVLIANTGARNWLYVRQ